MENRRSNAIIILIALCVTDIFVWYRVFHKNDFRDSIYFLDVGQGDAILLVVDDVTILTDAGPDRSVVGALTGAGFDDRYIDVGIITHPERDHFYGFLSLLDRYRFGALIMNGRSADAESADAWGELLKKAERLNVPVVTVGAGDAIRYQGRSIEVLSPDNALLGSGALNDTAIVTRITTPDFRALLAADIGFSVERYLRERYDLAADVLKVPHHGSKHSSSQEFVAAVRPKVAVVQAGAHNRYGHPTEEALSRIESSGAEVFRTDMIGTVMVQGEGGVLGVFRNR